MARKLTEKKVKKKYKPKTVLYDTMQYVKTGMAPMSTASTLVMTLKLKNHGALDNLRHHKGTKEDVTVLTHAFITAQSIADLKVGGSEEYSEALDTAQEAILTISNRSDKWKKVQATPVEVDNLIYGMDVHDAQLAICTVSELEKAILLAKTAIRCNHPGKRRFDTRETL
jgi:hypothetical protein